MIMTLFGERNSKSNFWLNLIMRSKIKNKKNLPKPLQEKS